MIKTFIRHAANTLGLDIHKYSTKEWRWSYDVEDYYPVDSDPRWGFGKPPHPQLIEIFSSQRSDILALLNRLSQSSQILASVPHVAPSSSNIPFWSNGWFENFDAASLVGMLVCNKPSRYLEIGSGNSTKFARHAIDRAQLFTSLVSVDPEPREIIDALCDKFVRTRLENCDLSLFDELERGDILFFDGSHRVFTNSDVTVFFLELLPRLKSGVIIHIHDIFLPSDYPPAWKKRMYSEQYLLAAMLLCPQPCFKVLLPNFFACTDEELRLPVKSLMEPIGCIAQGWSFWIEKI